MDLSDQNNALTNDALADAMKFNHVGVQLFSLIFELAKLDGTIIRYAKIVR